MLRKCTFLPPHSHLIGQFVKRHPMFSARLAYPIRTEQHALAQWLRQYFYRDHGVRSVECIITFLNCFQKHVIYDDTIGIVNKYTGSGYRKVKEKTTVRTFCVRRENYRPKVVTFLNYLCHYILSINCMSNLNAQGIL